MILRRGKRPHQIQMEAPEPTFSRWKNHSRGSHMLGHLGGLAPVTGSAPVTDLSAHTWPHKSSRDHLDGWPGSRVAERMHGIKYWLPEVLGDQRTKSRRRRVTKHGNSVPLDAYQAKASVVGIFLALSGRQFLEIHRRQRASLHLRAGQGVRHDVLVALDMPDVRGELRDIRQMSFLPQGAGHGRGHDEG